MTGNNLTANRHSHPKIETPDALIDLIEQGMSDTEIGAVLKVDSSTIFRALKRFGLPPNPNNRLSVRNGEKRRAWEERKKTERQSLHLEDIEMVAPWAEREPKPAPSGGYAPVEQLRSDGLTSRQAMQALHDPAFARRRNA